MTVAKTTEQQILDMPPGRLFKYSDLKIPAAQFEALAASLSRLAKKGVIRRLKKGYYYIPKKSVFGELKPSQNEIVRKFTFECNSQIGYESGLSVFNALGLTTQVPNGVTIVTRKPKSFDKVVNTRIRFIKTNINFKKSDIKLLQILDALKNIKNIPDSIIENSIRNIKAHFSKFTNKDLLRILTFVKNYNPSTKALVGAIISDIICNHGDRPAFNVGKDNQNIDSGFKGNLFKELNSLKNTLNPFTIFNIGVSKNILPNKSDWRII